MRKDSVDFEKEIDNANNISTFLFKHKLRSIYSYNRIKMVFTLSYNFFDEFI